MNRNIEMALSRFLYEIEEGESRAMPRYEDRDEIITRAFEALEENDQNRIIAALSRCMLPFDEQ